ETGELQHELWSVNQNPCLAYSPDRELVASFGYGKKVRLWNPQTGELVAALAGHTGIVTQVAFSPNGLTLASAGDDSIHPWKPPPRERVAILDDVETAIPSLVFTADNRTLVAGDANGRVHFWRAADQ